MMTPYQQDISVVIDWDDLVRAVHEFGGGAVNVAALVTLLRAPKPIARVLRRIHVIVGVEALSAPVEILLRQVRADIHRSHDGRPDCLFAVHAMRSAERSDVVTLLISKSGYLPLLRELKSMGCRVELLAGPNVDPALLPAADEVNGLPGAIVLRSEEAEAA
jgi:NYN domain